MQRYTIRDFERDFPDDAACLEFLRTYLYPDGIFCPKCQRITKHHRDAARPSYSCDYCGHHVHPTAGTIFHKSSTSLRLWFHAVFLMAQTRCGISAKQLERELGVTYKTAWRMFKQIRSLLEDGGDTPLDGTVEMDEAYIGPKAKTMHASKRAQRITGRGSVGKTPVFGMAKRQATGRRARIVAQVVDGTSKAELLPHIVDKVLPATTVYSDEWASYDDLGKLGYQHSRVQHSAHVYVSGDVHTNTIEGFWSLLKRGIGGVYHSVSDKYLQHYVDEYAFRYNHGEDVQPMFLTFLGQVQKA